jgi:cytochrome c oxidase subunit 2
VSDVVEPTGERGPVGPILMLWAVLTIVGVVIAIFGTPWLMPPSASSSMHLVILTSTIFSVAAAPVAALVYAVALYALTRWRWRGEGVPPDGPPIRTHGVATATWLVASSVLTMFVLIWGLAALSQDQSGATSENAVTVNVTGQQWLWTFDYQNTAVKTAEPYLPVGRDVHFNVTSKDVVHGFWIVQMGVKINANPEVTTTVSVTPSKIGVYDIRCTEICGLNHAFMVTRVHVVSVLDFYKWLGRQPSRV